MNRCITCGMRVNRNKAHMSVNLDGRNYLVCCPLCQSEFEKNPETYINQDKKKESVVLEGRNRFLC